MPKSEAPLIQDLDAQARLCKIMFQMPVVDAVGVALSYLLLCSHKHPEVLRRVLNEPVVREGATGVSMITTLTRVSRS